MTTTNEFDAEWARILAEVPDTPPKPGERPTPHRPFRLQGEVYTFHATNGPCNACVADHIAMPHDDAEKKRRRSLCTSLPGCDDGVFALFTPADYTIMVARGDADEP